jgi:hypothetical protein
VNQVNVTNTVVNVTKVTNVYNSYTTNNTTDINRITYVNRAAPHAVTVVSHDTFVNARPIARNIVAVPQREIEQAPVSHIARIEPVGTSVLGAGQPTRVAPPPAVVHRQVVAERPPAPQAVPLNQRRDPLVSHPVRPETAPSVTRSDTNRSESESTPRPNPPAIHPEWQAPRPGSAPARSEEARGESARPETARPESVRPEPARPVRPDNESRSQSGWSNPLAKPAPPVHEKTPQQAQQEEKKYQRWEQQGSKPEPQRPPERNKDNKENKDNKDKHHQ